MIINERFLLERATFMDKLKSSKVGDSFNIFSGSRNFVVTQVAGDRFKVIPGKGYDKGMTAYIEKCYINPKSDQIVTRNALENFIRAINAKNGWREDLDISSESDDELNESSYSSKIKTKNDALKAISHLYPGKGNKNTEQWKYYNDLVIDLVHDFKITKDELKKAQS